MNIICLPVEYVRFSTTVGVDIPSEGPMLYDNDGSQEVQASNWPVVNGTVVE